MSIVKGERLDCREVSFERNKSLCLALRSFMGVSKAPCEIHRERVELLYVEVSGVVLRKDHSSLKRASSSDGFI